jgi:hypothetical protein
MAHRHYQNRCNERMAHRHYQNRCNERMAHRRYQNRCSETLALALSTSLAAGTQDMCNGTRMINLLCKEMREVGLATNCRLDGAWFGSRRGQRVFCCLKPYRRAVEPTHLLVQSEPGFLPGTKTAGA